VLEAPWAQTLKLFEEPSYGNSALVQVHYVDLSERHASRRADCECEN